jgi:hypothetical protein
MTNHRCLNLSLYCRHGQLLLFDHPKTTLLFSRQNAAGQNSKAVLDDYLTIPSASSRPVQRWQAVPRNIDQLHTTVGENHGTKEHRNQQCQANEQINLRHTLSPYE